ncbi:MAG: hypothetical protein M0017_05405 [Desulfobacteraceae bacterium]|nr:hypothetical protein [Desulfobacteraceae bacterium]
MIVDPTSVAVLSPPKGPVTPEVAREQPQPEPPAAQTAQTQAATPGVVANFSAAALLTQRAVSSTLQSADQEPVKKEEEKEKPEARHRPGEKPQRGSRLDVRV